MSPWAVRAAEAKVAYVDGAGGGARVSVGKMVVRREVVRVVRELRRASLGMVRSVEIASLVALRAEGGMGVWRVRGGVGVGGVWCGGRGSWGGGRGRKREGG